MHISSSPQWKDQIAHDQTGIDLWCINSQGTTLGFCRALHTFLWTRATPVPAQLCTGLHDRRHVSEGIQLDPVSSLPESACLLRQVMELPWDPTATSWNENGVRNPQLKGWSEAQRRIKSTQHTVSQVLSKASYYVAFKIYTLGNWSPQTRFPVLERCRQSCWMSEGESYRTLPAVHSWGKKTTMGQRGERGSQAKSLVKPDGQREHRCQSNDSQ